MNNCARRGGLDKSATSAFRTDPRGTPQAFCVREPDGRLIAREAGESLQYYFFDLLGSTILMAPAAENNPTDRFYYTPWGQTVTTGSRASTGATTANPYRYVGNLGYYHHHQDANLADWMQLGVRFYEPELGRFERRNPITRAEISDYAYVDGQPEKAVDPSGLDFLICSRAVADRPGVNPIIKAVGKLLTVVGNIANPTESSCHRFLRIDGVDIGWAGGAPYVDLPPENWSS